MVEGLEDQERIIDMTERLYYGDTFLFEFDAKLAEVVRLGDRIALVLDRTAFYPTSGGQIFDTGLLEIGGIELRISEVVEDETGHILHYIDNSVKAGVEGAMGPTALESGATLTGARVRGIVNADRRRDHMRQHSGQHVVSAAFERLFGMATVSFHMGDESCTIDLATNSLSDGQVREAEREANRVVMEDRPVEIRSATIEQARAMGVRKIPDHVEGELRLIDVRDYDLNACGGTHVRSTGQVGPILLRKFEKVKQGFRVEFVSGERALATARRDFETLAATAGLYAAHIWTVPELVRKSQDEAKSAAKERKRLLEEIAELLARRMLADAPDTNGFKLITRVFEDRDISFIKLLAQKITAASPTVVLFGAGLGQPGVVFAQSPGLPYDMGARMKEALAVLGGRGGGNRDLAQGGATEAGKLAPVLEQIAAKLRA